MNLGGLKKLAATIGEKILNTARNPYHSEDRFDGMSKAMKEAYSTGTLVPESNHEIDRTVLVVKEKKNSVQIKCWTCSHLVWVKKGTRCHNIGLCGTCIETFDEKSNTTLVKAK